MTAWNPLDLEKMALPPCHIFFQMYVEEKKYLSCLMYQRSADIGLGVPYNVASYSLLTHIIAHITGLVAKEFIHIIGDCHIYNDHKEKLLEQTKLTPYPFPTIKISPELTKLDNIKLEHITLHNYNHHAPIKMKMSV